MSGSWNATGIEDMRAVTDAIRAGINTRRRSGGAKSRESIATTIRQEIVSREPMIRDILTRAMKMADRILCRTTTVTGQMQIKETQARTITATIHTFTKMDMETITTTITAPVGNQPCFVR